MMATGNFLRDHYTNPGGFAALECPIREGKAAATIDNATIESTGRFWLSPKAPLGWAQLELRRRTTRGGELVRESTSRFTIAEVRDKAVSELPDRQ